MFESVGWGEILVLALIGLFVLGPERLPGAVRWVSDTVRTVREYAAGARDQLRDEIGPEFEELRKPLEDLRSIRDLDPRRAVRRSLFDPIADGTWSGAATPAASDPAGGVTAGGAAGAAALSAGNGNGSHGLPAAGAGGELKGQSDRTAPLAPDERAPFDPDAT
ncbi:Sec-independent protein translocase protein TatB [Actinomycetospora endophytica]|uniref:Sec-independent protein translocase protein TatB n=1 Tax=Actinomycetospora endophytica TaxID=2291215 RepID=A0ABS8P8T3_9PSEU|nr:Sec-independent protein translocase protein TatB [Actinomycetospora endophytica]MCD2194332.1 Sec-independent protein translocase protein TatB [Actinomycetospora endophytica]